MKIQFLLVMVAMFVGSLAHADYEVCKGVARGGATLTIIGNDNNQEDPEEGSYITIKGNGHQQKVLMAASDSCGDVKDCYVSQDGGKTLKVSFYDEDNSASGWSAEYGSFKLSCKTVAEEL
jgi:hypothetical protein